jgi:hypothetical protein
VASPYDDFEDKRIKHLELIQAVVGRLGNDAFLMKGWALTVAGAFAGFAINRVKWELAAGSLFPTVIFWGLDAYFLRCERLFRCLYSKVRVKDPAIEPFFMGATGPSFIQQAGSDVDSWWKTVWSGTVLAFYGAITGAAIVVAALIAGNKS